jgi:hypothetical protein
MGDGRIFLKTFGASLFNDNLSNDPNLGRTHLISAGPISLDRTFNADTDPDFHSIQLSKIIRIHADPDDNNKMLTLVRSPRRAKLDCLTSGILS